MIHSKKYWSLFSSISKTWEPGFSNYLVVLVLYQTLPSLLQAAFNETVSICKTPLVKDCDVQGPEICRTEYESECWTKNEEHEVEDDVAECTTELEEKCEDETSGYTTNTKCSKWPKEICSITKKTVKKYTPITGCTKEPRELCAPAGCGFVQVSSFVLKLGP